MLFKFEYKTDDIVIISLNNINNWKNINFNEIYKVVLNNDDYILCYNNIKLSEERWNILREEINKNRIELQIRRRIWDDISQRLSYGVTGKRHVYNHNKIKMKMKNKKVSYKIKYNKDDDNLLSDDDQDEWEMLDYEETKNEVAIGTNTTTTANNINNNKTNEKILLLMKSKSFKNQMTVWVDGKSYTITNPDPELKLVDWLRRSIGITSVKVGCNEAGCGACTAVISYKTTSGDIISKSLNSCVHPLAACDGFSITTSYGLGNSNKGFHDIQKTLANHDGSQCGFCSPGMVMSMYSLLKNNTNPSLNDIEHNFDGNICRCTGYRAILSGMHQFAKVTIKTDTANNNDDDNNNNNKPCNQKELHLLDAHECKIGSCADIEDLMPSGKKNEVDKWLNYKRSGLLSYNENNGKIWCNPSSLDDVYNLLNEYSNENIRLVVGNTSIGVTKYYRYSSSYDDPNIFINIGLLDELTQINVETNNGVTFGAAVTIANLLDTLKTQIPNGGKVYSALVEHISIVANNPVRNVGCWAGNFMLHKGHPNFPSDLLCIFSVAGAIVTIKNTNGTTKQLSIRDFLNTKLLKDEILYSLYVPYGNDDTEYFNTWKIADRHQNSHPIINAAFKLVISGTTIQNAIMCIGGLGGPYEFCDKTVANLINQSLTVETFATALPIFYNEVKPPPDPINPTWKITSAAYRQSLATSLFYKFSLYVLSQQTPNPLPPSLGSAFIHYKRMVSSGVEVYYPDHDEYPLSEPIHKLGALMQAAGEAQYTDDIPTPTNGLESAYVTSTIASGEIYSIDASKALSSEGVYAFITAKDLETIGANNSCGMFPGDEEVFSSGSITYMGQPIGLIIADTYQHARDAAKLVSIGYKQGDPPIFDIPDAIVAGSYLPPNQYMSHLPGVTRGNMATGFSEADLILKGDVYTYEQYHFYMEAQTSLAVPKENNSLRIYISSQGPAPVRGVLVGCLNKPANKIIVSTRRAGGGFGGKLTRCNHPAAAVSIAAELLQRPVRIFMDRNDDMITMGKRAATYGNYKVGVKNDGTITAYSVDFYWQGGHAYDTSFGSFDMMQLWADNTYFIPNYSSSGKCCKTNIPPGTAMRAPGALQGIFIMEEVIERVSFELKMDTYDLRVKNFYKKGDTTPYLQPIEYISLQTVWSQLLEQSKFTQRQQEVEEFNKNNRWRKRGIHMIPTKYPMAVWGYQASVIINVQAEDGTVMISHSGCEIGQGINTKIAQAVAYGLNIPLDMITIESTSTEKIPNFGMTGGSATSETHVAAALDGTTKLNKLLEPYKKDTWLATITAAQANFVNLSVTGYFAMTSGPSGYPFTYYVYAAACTEVEVDILTGEVEILQVDIVYDCGTSLNNALDVGQVEGAFVMGIGYFLTEDVYKLNGKLISNGTWDYKPPCSLDIPINFNVTFLKDTPNQAKYAVLSSKATGEPPYQLSISVFYAVKDAIYAARSDIGITDYLELSPPATVDKIQQACETSINDLKFQ